MSANASRREVWGNRLFLISDGEFNSKRVIMEQEVSRTAESRVFKAYAQGAAQITGGHTVAVLKELLNYS
jgi:hypothetical protein